MELAIVWLRQDLRLLDNPALYYAFESSKSVIIIYILDEKTYPLGGAQRWWLFHSLEALQKDLLKRGLTLILKRGKPEEILLDLIKKYQVSSIFWNHCYEPSVSSRDIHLKNIFEKIGIQVKVFNGSLLSDPRLIKNKQGSYFKVFSHYWKACCAKQEIKPLLPIPRLTSTKNLQQSKLANSDDLLSWNLLPKKPDWSVGIQANWQPGEASAHAQLKKFIKKDLRHYAECRDFPAQDKTSYLSPHLHFGELSPWQVYHAVKQAEIADPSLITSSESYLRELGWREFAYYLLYHFPGLSEKNFNAKFNNFPWENNKLILKSWQKGKTGYPIVDAGMRQLWHMGYMHNRVRMIVASFLTKDLLIDWRVGAAWFWDTLVDADLASNAMNWQWVAGSGVDAAPYFRIFNPTLQGEKFDPNGDYVRRWVPELEKLPSKYIHRPWQAPKDVLVNAQIQLGKNYPLPIVEHKKVCQHALKLYKQLPVK